MTTASPPTTTDPPTFHTTTAEPHPRSTMNGAIDPRLGAGPPTTDNAIPPPPPPPPQSHQSHHQHQPPPPQHHQQQQYGNPPPPPPYSGGGVQQQQHHTPQHHPYFFPSPAPHVHTPHQPGASSSSSPAQGAPYGTLEGGADDPKRARACEACRGLKVRCDQDPEHPEIPCKRCAKAGRQCVITAPSRKRQKKADSRVAELEKKLDALTAALHQQNGTAAGGVQGQAAEGLAQLQGFGGQQQQYAQEGVNDGAAHANKRRRVEGDPSPPQETPTFDGADVTMQAHLSRLGSRTSSSTRTNDDPLAKQIQEIQQPWNATNDDLKHYLHRTSAEEFVSRINSLINPEMAAMIFDRYNNQLAPHLPAVVFPPGTTAEQVFKEKPILYVCILSAASFRTLHPETSKQLASEAVGAIADCVVRNGAKSLELIQAMQVVALFYKPPEQAERTNFYQIIHMAAVMALDIGLGKRFNPTKARRGFGGPNAQYVPGPGKTLPQDSDTLEARRAWLTCYYLCASASMVLRRPNLVRWTNYMKECIEVLESHPDAFASDKLFCQHVKIQHICEDIGLQFLMDDNTANISITDPKVTYALNVLENELKTWKENIPPSCRGQGLEFFEHVANLYLHEIALHFNHNVEDFRMPFTEESLKSVTNTSDTLTANQMSALEACLRAAHGILDTLLGYELETIKTLPMLLFFVRCVYAIVILIKMHVAVCTPNSELGKMMKPEDLRVEFYIDSLIRIFSYVSKDDEARDARPHPKVLHIMGILREWFGRHKENALGVPPQQGKEQTSGPAKVEKQDGQYSQTPLHLLSQVATGNQQQQAQQHQQAQPQQQQRSSTASSADWNFNTPSNPPQPVSYKQDRWPTSTTAQQDFAQPSDPNLMVDPTNGDYGWGSGFEQAMDIALGGMDGLQAGGLDGWFMGDSMAPFAFQGDQIQGQGW